MCRLLKIDGRQLRTWERQGLIAESDEYRFSDLLSLKTILRLRQENCSPKAIRSAVSRLRDSEHSDVRVYKDGKRVRIQIGRDRMEPDSGQLLFDFTERDFTRLLALPNTQKSAAELAAQVRKKLEADRWFERGLELEQIGAPYEQIIDAYKQAAELDPQSAGALVNLGTVYFNGHAWADAEEQYLRAISIDPNYALAHFNLANLYDEQGDAQLALRHYQEALRLYPSYADAHYNLALLYQGMRDSLNAVRHWRAYLKLDTSSTWAQIARRELKKLESFTIIPGRGPQTLSRG